MWMDAQPAFMQTRLIGEIMFEFLVGTAAAIYIWKHFSNK